ncbi:unnamed protein product [Triticum turgidum subsp. durum]|uniref:Uncharacterized protein n=1 Tax=Triticum turgidum subsp. durum TaxID=4567 RepID=A0A9R1Q628_TRITD|nr:unnamed protein product [Triticum turgidum subsp. durum]
MAAHVYLPVGHLPPWACLPEEKEEGMQAQQQEKEAEKEGGGGGKRRKVAADITIDLDILDCPVCYQPLRPPIFQGLSYGVCFGVVATGGCKEGEQTRTGRRVDKGGVRRTDDRRRREGACTLQKPIWRRGSRGSRGGFEEARGGGDTGFEGGRGGGGAARGVGGQTGITFWVYTVNSGPTAVLLEHFSGKHKWHSPKVTYNKAFRIRIHVGSTVLVGEDGNLFLVNMTMESRGGVISVCSVQPHTTGSSFRCKLTLSCTEPSFSQSMEFLIRSTNLYDGFPKDCFQFLVPKVLL